MSIERPSPSPTQDCAAFQNDLLSARPLPEATARHLLTCPSCRSQREAVEQLAQQHRSISLPVRPELRGKVLARLLPLLPASDPSSGTPAAGSPTISAGTTIATGMLLLVSLIIGAGLYLDSSKPVAPSTESGPMLHSSHSATSAIHLGSPQASGTPRIATGSRDAVPIPPNPNDE